MARMNPYWLLYNAVTLPMLAAVAPLACLVWNLAPADTGRRWRQRFGLYPRPLPPAREETPLVWIQAVSVGEVAVAATLVEALEEVRPGLTYLVSSTTKSGHQVAQARLGQRATCVYYPLDFAPSVHLALQRVKPDVVVCVETELWPNFLAQAQAMRVPTVLVNGRISARSFANYRKIKGLLGPILRGFSGMAVVSAADARRLLALGAPKKRLVITGNLKGAGLAAKATRDKEEKMRRLLDLRPEQPVLVAGSIRRQELEWLPAAYLELRRDHHDLVGIFAPRHLQRVEQLGRWCRANNISYQLYSDLVATGKRRAAVVVVDCIGVLFDLYSVAWLVFCGGSLVATGGQNILEPAAWGKMVFHGPHMENFLGALEILERAECSVQIHDVEDLVRQMRAFLSRPQELAQRGTRARAALADRDRVARRQAELVVASLEQGHAFRPGRIHDPVCG